MPPTLSPSESPLPSESTITYPLHTTTPLSQTPFTITSFPHILQQIVELSPKSSLAALVRCSKPLFHFVIPHLYQNLRMTQQVLASLVEIGKNSTEEPNLFSQTMKDALSHVRSLNLLDYDPGFVMPIMPSDVLAKIPIAILHLAYETVRPWELTAYLCTALPQNLPSIRDSHLHVAYTRDTDRRDNTGYDMKFADLPDTIRIVTLLARSLIGCAGMPLIERNFSAFPAWAKRSVTVVLLPDYPFDPVAYTSAFSHIDYDRCYHNLIEEASYYSEYRIVGAEYFKITASTLQARIDDDGLLDECNFAVNIDGEEVAKPLKFVSFIEWLEEQDPGSIFTEEEEAELRRADKLLLAHVKGELESEAEEVTQSSSVHV